MSNILIEQNMFYDLIILLLHDHQDSVKQIAHDFIQIFKENENSLIENEKNIIKLYIDIIQEILNHKLTFEKTKELNMLLSKYKTHSLVMDNTDIYNNLNSIIKNNISEEMIDNIKKRFTNILLWYKYKENLNKLNYQLNKFKQTIDEEERSAILEVFDSYVNNLSLVSSTVGVLNSERVKGIESINLKNKSDLKIAITDYSKTEKENLIQLGLKGLNMMNHPSNGFSLGSSIIFAALSHHFKSSILLNITRWLIEYNDFSNLYKNPLLLFISLENKANKNLMWLFKRFYYNQHKEDPDVFIQMDKMSDDEIINFLYNYLEQKNTTLVIERFRTNNFGYEELVKLCTKYENSGFKIVSLILDYMSLMKKDINQIGSGFGTASAIQDLYNKICNFVKDANILLFSAHQLNRTAATLATQFNNPVKHFNESHLAFSTDVHREIDILIFMHILRLVNGTSYLTMKQYKNRYNNEVPENYKYVAYQLHKHIGLIDDLTGKEFHGVRNMSKIINNAMSESDDLFNSGF